MDKILFVELLGGIGDVSIALSSIQALGRSYPEAKLTVLTFAPGGELLEGDPLIDRIVCVEKDDTNPHLARNAVKELLSQEKFDLIVSDTNYDGIEQVIQNSGASRVITNLWRSPPPNERVGDRFIQILLAEELILPEAIAAPQLHLSPSEQHYTEKVIGKICRPLVILYPDAGMAIKRWSNANFVTLGLELQQRYNATIVVPIGSDPQQAEQIAREIGGATQVLPRGTLRELATVMASADLVVASDTGSARIAAAVGTPTITLFGPSWHERYGQPPPHLNLQGYPECPERMIHNFTLQQCWYRGICPFDRWQTCMDAIAPADVLAAAMPILDFRF
ncbi:MAG TPA: glycosyl transferase [Cyanobacteria bacterium UBA11049]|nr:glycosyl transferase [Cyanobacteria bacterium UBA11049]